MAELPDGTVTMLFSDIEGSTLLLKRLGAQWGEALSAQRSILREVFAAHGGHELGTEGDSFFVVFGSARQAVEAALEGQRRLHSYGWPGGVPLRVRMGLHTGEPRRHEEGYVGLDVHRAARIASTASGGQIVLSEATHLMAPAVKAGVAVRDLGWHRLKDLDQPEHLYDLVQDGLPADFPLLRSLGTRARLPQPATAMIGRRNALDAVEALFTGPPPARLVTLTGPGGTGKTRLSLAVADSLETRFPHGVFFVPLHAADRAALVWAGIAEAAGASADTELLPEERALRFLADRRVLLVLDNLEQIHDADAVVAQILREAPDVSVLATSRRPLHLVAEHVYPVGPLEVAHTTHADLAAAEESPGVALFVQRARMAAPAFALTEANVDDVVRLCRKLDGLPLAIELAAARAALLTPAAMLRRIDQRLGTGVSGADRVPRQRTLGGTIRWSYDLLDEVDQTVFRRLGVFSTSCDLAAIETVTSSADIDALDVVSRLVDLSLLQIVPGPDSEPRVTMLNTIRSFASDLLASSAEADEIRLRHAAWCADAAATVVELLPGPSQMSALDQMEAIEEEVRTALDWCLQPDLAGPDLRSEIGFRLLGSMARYWYRFGYVAEARGWYERAVAVAGTRVSTEIVDALHGVAVLLLQRNDVEAGNTLLEKTLDMARQLGDRDRQARESNSLGIARRDAGDPVEARRLIQASVSLASEAKNEMRQAIGLTNMVTLLVDAGEYDAAVDAARQAIELDRRREDPWGTAINEANLTLPLLRSEGVNVGYEHLCRVAPGIVELADAELSINVLELFAITLAEMGEPLRAAQLVGAADAQRDAAGMPRSDPDKALLRESVEPVKAAADPQEWQRAYAVGTGLSVNEAVAIASPVRAGG